MGRTEAIEINRVDKRSVLSLPVLSLCCLTSIKIALNSSFRFGLAFILAMMGVTGGVYKGYGQDNCLRYVNPFIGTARSDVPTKWGSYGGTYPGAVAPSGAIQLTPETRISKGGGYDYADSAIYYFSCFRHSSGFPGGSSGRFFVMPVATMDGFEAREYCRGFLHSNEVAHPGYYKVVFDDNHTVVEATTTARTGMFRFTFPPHVIPRIFIGDAGNIVRQS
jgi:putative alpha-1,2-mannosidase